MASLTALECGGGVGRVSPNRGWSACPRSPCNHTLPMEHWKRRSGIHIRRRQVARAAMTAAANPVRRQRLLMSTASSTQHIMDTFSRGNQATTIPTRTRADLMEEEKDEGESVSTEKLDAWMRESIVEIVRNIGEAPFLVLIVSDKDASTSLPSPPPVVRLERETADAESWPQIKGRWNQGSCPPPDGIILVEELTSGGGGGNNQEDEQDGEREACDCPSSSCSSSGESHNNNKKWGLVIQGRGLNCAACYILDTCRVQSAFGFCTHFCLAKAKCFGDTPEMQLKNAWLLQGRQ